MVDLPGFDTVVSLILVGIVIALLVSNLMFVLIESKLLFDPSRHHVWSPDDSKYVGFEQRSIGRHHLESWYFPGAPNSPLVIYCHGNTGNISTRRRVVDLFRHLNISVLMFDYRGYGRSPGKPSLDHLKEDGDAAYAEGLRLGYSEDRIVVWGESLGGIVATHIASTHRPGRLLLLATLSDLSSLCRQSGGIMGWLAYPFLKCQDESNLKRLKRTKCPCLVIHSVDDSIIPYAHGSSLFLESPHSESEMMTITGPHAHPRLSRHHVRAIGSFCGHPIPSSSHLDDMLDDLLDQLADTTIES